jgi:hypothetical protein
MNWVTLGKWLGILAAIITQIGIPLCNGQGLSMTAISAVIAAIIAAGVIHGGQAQDRNLLAQQGVDLGRLRKARRR